MIRYSGWLPVDCCGLSSNPGLRPQLFSGKNPFRMLYSFSCIKKMCGLLIVLKRAYAKLDSIRHENQLHLFPSTSLSEGAVYKFLDRFTAKQRQG